MDILDIINITTIKALSKPNQNIPSQTGSKINCYRTVNTFCPLFGGHDRHGKYRMIISLLYTSSVYSLSSYSTVGSYGCLRKHIFIILTICHITMLLLQDTGIVVQQLIYVDPA